MECASEMILRAAKTRLRISEVPITFHPDGRDRPPHLRPWRDGWRHVKLILLSSPGALFLVPGITLILLGLLLMVIQVAGPLHRPVELLGFRMDFHRAILGSLMTLVGYQLVTIHFFARAYSVTYRIREEDELHRRGSSS
jgi:hypothetical protein